MYTGQLLNATVDFLIYLAAARAVHFFVDVELLGVVAGCAV